MRALWVGDLARICCLCARIYREWGAPKTYYVFKEECSLLFFIFTYVAKISSLSFAHLMILIQTPSVTIFYRAVGGERYARIHSACTWHWQNCLVAGRRRSSFYSQNQVLIGQSSNLCPNVVQSWATEGWKLSFQSLQEMICGIRSPTGTETQLDTCEFTHTPWRDRHRVVTDRPHNEEPIWLLSVAQLVFRQTSWSFRSQWPLWAASTGWQQPCATELDVLMCPDPCMVQSESSVRSLCGLGQSIAGII